MTTTAPRRATAVAAASALAALLVLTGCSAGSDGGSAGGESETAADAPEAAREFSETGGDDAAALDADGAVSNQPRVSDLVRQRSVISTGVVSLLSDDAGDTRADVLKVVDVHRGVVTDEQTATDADGDVSRSRLVVRVPVVDFYEAVEELEGVAELESSDKSSEDVSTQVIDTEVRIRAQEKSLRRIELLLGRAQTIRDVVAIESELTRRQADLDSLKSQQAFLADQTSMSTITVHIEEKAGERTDPDTDEAGFLAGLEGGWKALGEFATVLATIAGALLPWLVVLLVLGWPTWLVVRRLVRARPAPTAPPVAEA